MTETESSKKFEIDFSMNVTGDPNKIEIKTPGFRKKNYDITADRDSTIKFIFDEDRRGGY